VIRAWPPNHQQIALRIFHPKIGTRALEDGEREGEWVPVGLTATPRVLRKCSRADNGQASGPAFLIVALVRVALNRQIH